MITRLESFLEEVSEKTTQSDQYPVLTSSKNGLFLQDGYFNKQVASKDNKGYKIIRRGEFTYRAMSDTGEFYPNMLECAEIGIVSPAYPVFRISNDIILPDYLKYYFRSSSFQKSITSFVQGSTRASMKFAKMKTIGIDLPSKEDQQKIVLRLDLVRNQIKAKTEELIQLDDLIKARFVEMFKGKYDSFKVGEKLKTTSGGTPKSSVSEYYDGGNIPWLTSGEVNYGDITKPSNYITEKGLNNSSAKWVPENSIVIAMYGATAGKVGIVRYKTTTNQAVCSVLPNDNFNQEFLRYAFQDISEELTSKAIGGGQPNISQAIIKNSYIVDAPIEEQERFASFAKQVDKSKFAISQSLLLLIKAFSASFISHSEQISALLSSCNKAG